MQNHHDWVWKRTFLQHVDIIIQVFYQAVSTNENFLHLNYFKVLLLRLSQQSKIQHHGWYYKCWNNFSYTRHWRALIKESTFQAVISLMGLICFITAPLIYAALFNIPFLLSLWSSGRERKAAATSSLYPKEYGAASFPGMTCFHIAPILCVLIHQYPTY